MSDANFIEARQIRPRQGSEPADKRSLGNPIVEVAFIKLGGAAILQPVGMGWRPTHIPSPTLEHGVGAKLVVPDGPMGRTGATLFAHISK